MPIRKLRFINADLLKLIAAALMLVDHIGYVFAPRLSADAWRTLRIIGRLSMPLFAFAIAEGCRYTRNKSLHFIMLFGLGVCCFLVYLLALGQVYYNILITFSFSVLSIYALQFLKRSLLDKQSKAWQRLCAPALFIGVIAFTYVFCYFNAVDYGFWGCMLPVFAALFDFHRIPAPALLRKTDCLPIRILTMAIGLLFLTLHNPFSIKIAAWAFCSIPILLLYSGKKGNWHLKYFFYIFYPAHLVILQGIFWLL
ncbi:MAG: hypothetical protein IJV83_02965 [Clostridia bacterium]|nr:hypothetical protein [Clostridia bacterium]